VTCRARHVARVSVAAATALAVALAAVPGDGPGGPGPAWPAAAAPAGAGTHNVPGPDREEKSVVHQDDSAVPAAIAGLMVLRDDAEYEFADHITFVLAVEAPTDIEDVVLRYTVGGADPVNRRIPEFIPGKQVTARHTEDLLRGEIPPASEIEWWWEVAGSSGESHTTPRQSLRYLDESFDWQSRTEDGFRVWWYGDMEPVAVLVTDEAVAVMDRLTRIVGSGPDRQIQIVVYATQADLRPALAQRGETYEAMLATLGARVAPDVLVVDAGTSSDELPDVLAHELSHMVANMHIGRDYVNLPAWLDEGLAMYSEGPLEADEQRLLDVAIADDSLMSVRSLTSFPGDAELVPLAYAESRGVVEFLIESEGSDRFLELLDVLADGRQTPDEALTTVYGLDQLSLYQAYRASLGLAPAEAPADGSELVHQRPPRRVDSRGGVCPAALLLAPALALVAVAVRTPKRRRIT